MIHLLQRIINWVWAHDLFVRLLPHSTIQPRRLWKRPDNDNLKHLPEDQVYHIWQTKTCPYCGGELFAGPRGGLSQNYYCGNVDQCNSRFNVVEPAYFRSPFGELEDVPAWGQFTGECPTDFIRWRQDKFH